MLCKRGQAAPAAVLLAIIVGLIVVFIMLIPPSERAKLLEDNITGEEDDSEIKGVLLEENPGRLSHIKEKDIEKVIPSFHIFTQEEPTLFVEKEYLTVKNAVFSSQPKEITFKVKDLDLVQDVLLSFSIDSYRGDLIILLNGEEIFNKETYKIRPLKLSSSLISKENTLTFRVSSPGIAFWRTNVYELSNIKVVADITDVSNQENKNLFTIDKDEIKNMEDASLKFYLSCLSSKKGKLEIKLNDYLVFSGTPDSCDDIYTYKLPTDQLKVGSNWVTFKTETGNYQFDQAAVKIKLEKPTYPSYYFDLDSKYFVNDTQDLKGDYDVILSLEFTDDENKEADIYINGHKVSFDTYKIEFSRKLDNYVEPWINSIKIIPENSFEVKTLKVMLKD